MKKIWKKFSLAFAVVMCVTLAVPAMAQVGVAVAGDETTTITYAKVLNYLQIKGFSNKGEVGKKCYVTPQVLGATAGLTNVKIETTVTDQLGNTVQTATEQTATEDELVYFIPVNAGRHKVTYKITYIDVTEKTLATKDFYVQVVDNMEKYTLELKSNDVKLIPSKAKVNSTVEFPEILVLNDEGDVIATPTGTKIITECDVSTAWNADTKTLTLGADTKKVYTVTYKLVDETNTSKVYAYKTVEVESVAANYKFDYKYEFSETKPDSGVIGKEITLPGIKATNVGDDSNIAVSYTVAVVHDGETYTLTDGKNKFKNKEILSQNEYGQYVFTPFDEGKFEINYTITAYGNGECKTDGSSFTIENVVDNLKPEVKVTMTGVNYGKLDASEALATTWGSSDYVVLPIYATNDASKFLGDDNIVVHREIIKKSTQKTVFNEEEFFGTVNDATITSLADLNKRALVFNQSQKYNGSTIYVKGEPYQIAKADTLSVASSVIKLENGKYTLKYIAYDKTSKEYCELTDSTFEFEIVSGNVLVETNKPTSVEFATDTKIPTSMILGKSTTFNEPTAKQVETEDDGGNIITYNDARLSTVVTYKVSTVSVPEKDTDWVAGDGSWLTFDEETAQYTLSIPETTTYKNVRLIATSTNDAGYSSSTSKVIKLISSVDEVATTVSSVVTTVEGEGLQNEKTILPTVTYADNIPNAVNLEITIVDKDGNEYAANGYNTTYDTTTKTFSGANFIPAQTGNYTITYVSSDKGNNLTVLVFTVNIAENPKDFSANFANLPSTLTSGDVEINSSIALPDIAVNVSHPSRLQAQNWSIVLVEGTTNMQGDGETEIWFNKTGTYKIKFVCPIIDTTLVAPNNVWKTIESEVFTIKVVDTVAPTIENKVAIDTAMINLQANINTQMENPTTAFETGTFSLPIPLLSDEDLKYSTVTITSSTTTNTIKLDGNVTGKLTDLKISEYFVRNDVAKIVYSIQDAVGNKTELNYNVNVGDVTIPDIKITNENNKYLAKSYNFNSQGVVNFKFDLNMLDLSDNEDGEELLYKDEEENVWKLKSGVLSITVKNMSTAESQTITSTTETPGDKQTSATNLEYSFKLSNAGEYQIIIAYSDTANKQATDSSLSFQVVDPAANALSTETVLGIVLIVVAVLVLGGVVTYFVVTRKKYKNKF